MNRQRLAALLGLIAWVLGLLVGYLQLMSAFAGMANPDYIGGEGLPLRLFIYGLVALIWVPLVPVLSVLMLKGTARWTGFAYATVLGLMAVALGTSVSDLGSVWFTVLPALIGLVGLGIWLCSHKSTR